MASTSRVGRPSKTGSTPSASGSSVPACPTRFWSARRRILATTSCEVQPTGLSTFRMPVRSVLLMLALLLDRAHQAHDAVTARQRTVEHELEVRGVAQVQALLEVVVQE